MPQMEYLIEKIASKKFLSVIDLASGYWQVPLDSESRQKSAFVTHKGLYEWTVLPFGLSCARSTFQRLMDMVLHDLSFAHAYLDDVVIFSDSFEEHMEHLETVFKRLLDAGLTVKVSMDIGEDSLFRTHGG